MHFKHSRAVANWSYRWIKLRPNYCSISWHTADQKRAVRHHAMVFISCFTAVFFLRLYFARLFHYSVKILIPLEASDENWAKILYPCHTWIANYTIFFQKSNELNKKLLDLINDSRDIHLVGSEVRGLYFLRLSIGSAACDEEAVKFAWATVQKYASKLLNEFDL